MFTWTGRLMILLTAVVVGACALKLGPAGISQENEITLGSEEEDDG